MRHCNSMIAEAEKAKLKLKSAGNPTLMLVNVRECSGSAKSYSVCIFVPMVVLHSPHRPSSTECCKDENPY